jgi:hypothetical protein
MSRRISAVGNQSAQLYETTKKVGFFTSEADLEKQRAQDMAVAKAMMVFNMIDEGRGLRFQAGLSDSDGKFQ